MSAGARARGEEICTVSDRAGAGSLEWIIVVRKQRVVTINPTFAIGLVWLGFGGVGGWLRPARPGLGVRRGTFPGHISLVLYGHVAPLVLQANRVVVMSSAPLTPH